ncbi:MAG: glycoside hydrolase family 55 protein [Clostridia bacterium]|nr:glycoside hydrolase family 55 protein [Clostridia bacterium]
MKKTASFFLCAVLVIAVLPFAAADNTGAQRIVETVYPTDDVVIADVVATEAPYSADPTGSEDVSEALQAALNDCALSGGGTVFLPVGRYRLCSPISIPKFVTLRGDWEDPDSGNDYGTIIVADVASEDVMTPALITVGASAGAVGLTVWYPGQTLDEVRPYPFTFFVIGNGDYMLSTVMNCTLLNSYRGIGASSECENGISQCHEMFTVDTVKGTCLFEGLNSYNSADVDTYKTLYIDNRYWIEAGAEFNAPDQDELNAYTRSNGVGLALGDLEWPQFTDIRVSNMKYGVTFRKGFRYCFSGEFYGLIVKDCDFGMYIPEKILDSRGKSWGVSVCSSSLSGSELAVYNPGDNALVLTDVKINGRIRGRNIRRYKTDTSSLAPDTGRSYEKPDPILYVVEADTSGRTDASAAVNEKLAEAAATGGVVYLPGGVYRFDAPVTVPAGVELRGSSSVPTRDQGGSSSGTLILSYYGYDAAENAEAGDGLIILGGNGAGVNGIRIDFYANNPVDASGDYSKTVPAVYSSADDIYVTNTFITLASVGIRLENSSNAYIKKVVGCCCESMFSLEGCSGAYIEGCLQNGNALPRNGYSNLGLDDLAGRITENNLFDYVFIPITRVRTEFITLSHCRDVTVFNTFIYGGKSFLVSLNSSALVVNVGSDGSSKTDPMLRLSGGSLNILNSMRSTSDGKLCYRFYEAEDCASVRSYSSLGVDLRYREGPVLKNIGVSELLPGEFIYLVLQPLYSLSAAFGRISMNLTQK